MAENERWLTDGLEPFVQAMIICDSMYICPNSGKKTLLGLFSVLHARTFPASVPQLILYVAMTGGKTKTPVRIRLVDADEEREPLFEGSGELQFDDPLAIMELAMGVQNLTFPAAGEYRFQVYAFATLLMERRILMVQIPE